MNIESITAVLKDIKAVGSTKQKESLLKAGAAAHPEIREVLNAALASDLRYGVTVHEKDLFTITEQYTFVNTLEHLINNRPHNSNEKKNLLVGMINGIPSEDQRDLMIRIVNKDLNIGIGTTTVNKVLKSLNLPTIRNLEPMKAFKEKDTDISKLVTGQEPSFVQEKIDAARAFMVVDPNKEIAYFLTSTAKRVDSFTHITHLPMKMTKGLNPFVVDGELIAIEDDGSYMKRSKSNGLLNKASSGTIKQQDANRFVFVAWDYIRTRDDDLEYPLYNGSLGCDGRHYQERFDNLKDLIFLMDEDESSLMVNSVRLVPSVSVGNLKEAYNVAERHIREGKEGAIVRSPIGHYEPKRSRNLVKIKKAYMADVRVTWINEGKNAGTLGSLGYETDDDMIKGDVSGINDNLKKYWYENPHSILGRIIEVRYMEITTDKRTGEYTLYGPATFIRVRDDKNETSRLEELT